SFHHLRGDCVHAWAGVRLFPLGDMDPADGSAVRDAGVFDRAWLGMVEAWSLMRPSLVNEDVAAAAYIVSLWGARRRAWARHYWLFLTRGYDRPSLNECFGSKRIERRLRKIIGVWAWTEKQQ